MKEDLALLDEVEQAAKTVKGSERSWQRAGHEYTLWMDGEEVMVRANQLEFSGDEMEEGMSYYDEESLSLCGVEDFWQVAAYRAFMKNRSNGNSSGEYRRGNLRVLRYSKNLTKLAVGLVAFQRALSPALNDHAWHWEATGIPSLRTSEFHTTWFCGGSLTGIPQAIRKSMSLFLLCVPAIRCSQPAGRTFPCVK